MVLDQHREPFLEGGEEIGDRQRIELRQCAEQRSSLREAGNAPRQQAQHLGEQRPQRRFDGLSRSCLGGLSFRLHRRRA
jgi:hypothetical protein